MAQINLHVTPEFEEALEALVRGRRFGSKSDAIRYAVREAASPYLRAPRRDFSVLQGLLDRRTGRGKQGRPRMAELERELDLEMDHALATRRGFPTAQNGDQS